MADAALEGRGMRKDIDEDTSGLRESMATTIGVEEEDLTDEDLLGESTLAKIIGKTVTIASDEDAEKLEEIFEISSEDIELGDSSELPDETVEGE
jgi:hypothetical protein